MLVVEVVARAVEVPASVVVLAADVVATEAGFVETNSKLGSVRANSKLVARVVRK